MIPNQSSLRRIGAFLIISYIILGLPLGVKAHSLFQAADPVAQCAEGVRLFDNNQEMEALPLVEYGFSNRENAGFASPEDLGYCALVLGLLWNDQNNLDGALQAYQVALPIFHNSNNLAREGDILYNIAGIHKQQGDSQQALLIYGQALDIWRKLGDRWNEGVTLDYMGSAYLALSQYENAIASVEGALALERATNNTMGVGRSLANLGEANAHLGNYSQALEYYQQALLVWQDVDLIEGKIIALNHIGELYQIQRMYVDALDAYNRVLEISQAEGDRGTESLAFYDIGEMYRNLEIHTKALEAYQSALQIQRELMDYHGESNTLIGIGLSSSALGLSDQALDVYQEALAITRKLGERKIEGICLNNIGAVYAETGQLIKALEYYELARSVHLDVGNRTGEGAVLNSIGVIFVSQGQYSKALESFHNSLAIRLELQDKRGEAVTRHNIAQTYTLLGNYDDALDSYNKALTIIRELNIRTYEAGLLSGIGGVYYKEANLDSAFDYYQQALDIQQEISDRPGEATTLNNIGLLFSEQQKYEQALQYFDQALAIKNETHDAVGEIATLNNIGQAYLLQEEYPLAVQYYLRAIDKVDTVRPITGNDLAQTTFGEQYSDLYVNASLAAYRMGDAQMAFIISERGRARVFLDSIYTGTVEFSDSLFADLIAKEKEKYAARLALQQEMDIVKSQKPLDTALVADLERQIASLGADYQAALNAISERGDQLSQLVPGMNSILDVQETQSLLDEQTKLLSFWVTESSTLAFVIGKNSFDTVELRIPQSDLYAKIEALRSFSNVNDPDPLSAKELFKILIEPLQPYLDLPSIVIIPHGELHYLPFAALSDGAHYLIDDHSISFLPSASAWPFIKQNANNNGTTALILGNPAISANNLQPLQYAEKEARTVAGLYSAVPLLGKDATESVIRARASEVGLLHIAAHAKFDSFSPLYSAIYLAPDSAQDGLLETYEIYGLDLNQTELVVLSACDTQLGKLSTGDELIGLTRAFFFAGAPTIVSSLWQVDDHATELLMEKFYENLRKGLGKANALRQAQLDLRKNYPNPYYWAGFVLNGDGKGSFVPSAASTSDESSGQPSGGFSQALFGICCCSILLFGLLLAFVAIRRTRKSRLLRQS